MVERDCLNLLPSQTLRTGDWHEAFSKGRCESSGECGAQRIVFVFLLDRHRIQQVSLTLKCILSNGKMVSKRFAPENELKEDTTKSEDIDFVCL